MTDWGGLPLRTRTPRRTFPLRRPPPPRCHRASRASRLRLRRLLDDPAVAVLLQVPGQVRVAALHDSAVHEDVDEVGDHVVEETLVVGHDEHRSVRAAHRVHSICDEAQGVDVKPGIRLVQDAELWLEDCHLEDFVFLLLATGEAFVQPALHERLVETEEFRLVLDQSHEIHRIDLLEPAILPDRVEGRLEEIRVAYAGNLDRILERHEDAFPGAVLRLHREQILALEPSRAPRDLVGQAPGQDLREGRLAAPVRAHDGVDFSGPDREIDSLQDLLPRYLHLQILDLEHRRVLRPWKACSADRSLKVQAYADQFLGLHRELHREHQEDLLAETVHNHVRGILRGDAAGLAVEELILADLRRRRLVLHLGRRLLDLDVRERERGARRPDQEGVALGVVPGVRRALVDLYTTAVRVPSVPGGDALRDDRAPGVLSDMQHLRARVGLLVVVRERHGVELTYGVVALQDAARILPGDRGTGLDLGPRDLRVHTEALPPLRDEVVDPALPLLVAGVPVLDRGILDLRIVEGDQFDDRGMKLIRVPDRRRASFEVAHIRARVRDDQRAFELSRVLSIDPEVRGELHRASDARRHVGERAVAEDREEIVVEGDDGAEVLAHEVGMLEDRLGEGAEDDAEFRELVLERRRDRDAVQHGVDRDAGQTFLLLERDAEFRVQGPDLGIDILEALHFLLRLRGRVVDDVLIVDRGIADVRPRGLLHR